MAWDLKFDFRIIKKPFNCNCSKRQTPDDQLFLAVAIAKSIKKVLKLAKKICFHISKIIIQYVQAIYIQAARKLV